MKKPKVILHALLCTLVVVVLAAPVTGALIVANGDKITSPYGFSSPVITVTDSDIPAGGTITVDVSSLYLFVNSGLFNDANVAVSSDAGSATWTGAVSATGDILILTSAGGNTSPGENISVTFTGAGGNRWVTDTYGNQSMGLTVTRIDTAETASINFWIETVTPPPGGLMTTDGDLITLPDGISSPVITVIDSDIPENGTIIIDIPYLWMYVESGNFTDANVMINDTAAAAIWTRNVSAVPGIGDSDYITLTSTGGPTVAGENITVTFTGAGGNPWVLDTYGYQSMPVTVTRTDTAQTSPINFNIETVPPPPRGLTVTDGAKITEMTGNTSVAISIAETDILTDGTITIDVSGLNEFVAGGNLTEANIIIHDTAVSASWTGIIAGNILTLTSTGGNTTVGENVTITFTGAAGKPWTSNTYGNKTLLLIATRTDGFGEGTFNFMIEIVPPPPNGLTIADGAKITETIGNTTPVISIAEADILMDGTITIDVSGINGYVAGGALTNANIVINDDAASANWTGMVAGNTLTLTSTGGNTTIGENISVTFTGAGGGAWIANTHGNQTVVLAASRTDGLGDNTINFMIETTPPPGTAIETNFTVSKTADIAPLTVTFTDLSLGNATSWFWEFGDGSTSTLQNPDHTYVNVGSYTVNLTAANSYGSETLSQGNYIHILNGGIRETNTSVDGLTIANCGGVQTIVVDSSILPAALIPNSSVLEIQPPADRGLKNITIYAINGVGFSRRGSLISGNPTHVHLLTEEITPTSGFSNDVGTNASLNISIDLTSYPCNAVLSTKLWEGVIPEYDTKFRRIVDGNNGSVVGTAYTANISRTNFPPGAIVKLHMSVSSNWNTYPNLPGAPGMMFIWRIADDGNSGQILPTNHLFSDPIHNLDYYEAGSPNGLSTFGLSSITGNNNPFQMIVFAMEEVINPGNNENQDIYSQGGGGGSGSNAVAVTPNPNSGAISVSRDPGRTAKIYASTNGVITQNTTLQSTDGFATVHIGTGIIARDADGKPLSLLTIKAILPDDLPKDSTGASLSFAGGAYELTPDGATFSPGITISFTPLNVQSGQELTVKMYDHANDTWLNVPSSINPETGIITAYISHFCCFALFAEAATPETTPESTLTLPLPNGNTPAPTAMSTFVGMILWAADLIQKNLILFIGILVLAVGIVLFGRKRRRDRLMYLF